MAAVRGPQAHTEPSARRATLTWPPPTTWVSAATADTGVGVTCTWSAGCPVWCTGTPVCPASLYPQAHATPPVPMARL
jgi:hypothetical protein